MPKIHEFQSSGEAYDASQVSDEISHGDILVVASENAVAVLDKAWPVAVTEFAGAFHIVSPDLTTPGYFQKNDLLDSYTQAVVVAAKAGFEAAS